MLACVGCGKGFTNGERLVFVGLADHERVVDGLHKLDIVEECGAYLIDCWPLLFHTLLNLHI